MRSYIQQLHTKPDHHKRAFALAVSGGFTLIIFTIWSFVHFGNTATIAAKQDTNNLAAVGAADTVTPFEDMQSGLKNSIQAVKDGFNQMKDVSNSQPQGNFVDLNGGQ